MQLLKYFRYEELNCLYIYPLPSLSLTHTHTHVCSYFFYESVPIVSSRFRRLVEDLFQCQSFQLWQRNGRILQSNSLHGCHIVESRIKVDEFHPKKYFFQYLEYFVIGPRTWNNLLAYPRFFGSIYIMYIISGKNFDFIIICSTKQTQSLSFWRLSELTRILLTKAQPVAVTKIVSFVNL